MTIEAVREFCKAVISILDMIDRAIGSTDGRLQAAQRRVGAAMLGSVHGIVVSITNFHPLILAARQFSLKDDSQQLALACNREAPHVVVPCLNATQKFFPYSKADAKSGDYGPNPMTCAFKPV
jgi:hypothetical protein